MKESDGKFLLEILEKIMLQVAKDIHDNEKSSKMLLWELNNLAREKGHKKVRDSRTFSWLLNSLPNKKGLSRDLSSYEDWKWRKKDLNYEFMIWVNSGCNVEWRKCGKFSSGYSVMSKVHQLSHWARLIVIKNSSCQRVFHSYLSLHSACSVGREKLSISSPTLFNHFPSQLTAPLSELIFFALSMM